MVATSIRFTSEEETGNDLNNTKNNLKTVTRQSINAALIPSSLQPNPTRFPDLALDMDNGLWREALSSLAPSISLGR